MTTKLRFAALRRVSTEQQEKMGESLRTQTADIEEVVIGSLGGEIVGWYGGQEHATPGYEKKEVQRLLQDAAKEPKRFDAVIVAHPDRWSRDNEASRDGLEVFKAHDIRFWIGDTELDLFNPDHEMFLGISAVVNQFFASNQKRKSITNKIARAKRGLPSCGKKPFGRLWVWDDEKTRQSGKWVIDTQKKQLVQDVAKRYLAGEAIYDLAKEYGVNPSNLHKVLTKLSGTQWQIEFTSKRHRIHAVVPLTIPELLDEETIRAVKAKAADNRTFTHGQLKYEYLLGRMITCAHCGYSMFGQTNHQEHRYYRHFHHDRVRACPGPERKCWVPAEDIEDAVLRHLFETFGNPAAVQRAIEQATPNGENVAAAVERLKRITSELEKLEQGRQRVLALVVKGTIEQASADKQLETLKEREQSLRAEQGRLTDELAHLPSREKIQDLSRKVAASFRPYGNARLVAKAKHANRAFDEMSYADKRQLCEVVFGGKTADGRRMGVAVTWDRTGKKWNYKIEGHLIEESGPLPKWFFTFGAAPQQKQLVTKSATQMRCTLRRRSSSMTTRVVSTTITRFGWRSWRPMRPRPNTTTTGRGRITPTPT